MHELHHKRRDQSSSPSSVALSSLESSPLNHTHPAPSNSDNNSALIDSTYPRPQPSFLVRALSQAANSLWSSYIRPAHPPIITTVSSSSSSSQPNICISGPTPIRDGSDDDSDEDNNDVYGTDEDCAISHHGRKVSAALLSAVLNADEIPPGESPNSVTQLREISRGSKGYTSEQQTGTHNNNNNDNGDDDSDGDTSSSIFVGQLRAISGARDELERALCAGVTRHAALSRDLERATRALTVRSLELDNRALELDTREARCTVREARLGIDWVARTRRVCERERAIAAAAAQLAARTAALETRQQQQDEALRAEREHFWDVQRALSQVIANETEDLLQHQQKLRGDFNAKCIAAKKALAEMHNAAVAAADAILKDDNRKEENNSNIIIVENGKKYTYLRQVALETRRQFENVNGFDAANINNNNGRDRAGPPHANGTRGQEEERGNGKNIGVLCSAGEASAGDTTTTTTTTVHGTKYGRGSRGLKVNNNIKKEGLQGGINNNNMIITMGGEGNTQVEKDGDSDGGSIAINIKNNTTTRCERRVVNNGILKRDESKRTTQPR